MTEHNPQYRFDCEHCKFNWCCGILCACDLDLPDPPSNVRMKVNDARMANGYSIEFKHIGKKI